MIVACLKCHKEIVLPDDILTSGEYDSVEPVEGVFEVYDDPNDSEPVGWMHKECYNG